MDSTAVALKDVSKIYRSKGLEEVAALRDISFEAPAGSFVTIVGPSGCGKTTLLKIIGGLVRPTEGVAMVGGEVVDQPLRDFGMVFQQPVLLPWRTALGNVLLPIEMLGASKEAATPKAHELLDLVGLDGFAHRRPRELSGGMQMRVALCRALIHDPSVLLMDEPFSGVDELTRETLNDHLLDVWTASHKTMLLVSHNVEEAVYLSDKVVVLSKRPGRVVEVADIALERPRRDEIRYSDGFRNHTHHVRGLLRR